MWVQDGRLGVLWTERTGPTVCITGGSRGLALGVDTDTLWWCMVHCRAHACCNACKPVTNHRLMDINGRNYTTPYLLVVAHS